jgi:ankyrin repeat protein
LHHLLRKNRLDLFERKLDDGEDALQLDPEKNTPLLTAILQKKPDFVKAILTKRKGEKINEQKTVKGLTPLHLGKIINKQPATQQKNILENVYCLFVCLLVCVCVCVCVCNM